MSIDVNQKPMGVYTLEDGKKIYLLEILKGAEERVVVGDDYSGRNPRRFKLYSNTLGAYFLYRGVRVYLSDLER